MDKPKSKTIYLVIILASGGIAVIGHFLMTFSFDVVVSSFDFLSGILTGLIFVPILVRTILSSISSRENSSMKTLLIGAAAGFFNATLLTAVYVSMVAYSLNRSEVFGEIMASAFRGYRTYIFNDPWFFGIPGALVGAAFGVTVEYFLRKIFIKPVVIAG